MAHQANDSAEDKYRFIFETINVANALTEPLTDSIEHLLQISTKEMNSEEASVIVRDGGEGGMRFLAAIGKVAAQLINLKIPAGKGVAGFVFSSGQPIALSDVGEDETFYSEVDAQTGYKTESILATPMRYHGEIIGVLEYVNRIGEPNYTSAEMDKAALFADAIASLVNAYESANVFKGLSDKIISGGERVELAEVRGWLNELNETEQHKEMLDLALMVREIAGQGDAERRMCIEILQSILRYTRRGAETGFLNY